MLYESRLNAGVIRRSKAFKHRDLSGKIIILRSLSLIFSNHLDELHGED